MNTTFDLARTQAAMAKKGIDVMIASTPENLLYTAGLAIVCNAVENMFFLLRNRDVTLVVIPIEGEPTLVTTTTAAQVAREDSWISDQRTYNRTEQNAFQIVDSILREKHLVSGTVGIEELAPLYHEQRLKEFLPSATFRNATEVFNELRIIKSDEEIRRLRRAAETAERAMIATNEKIREGATELELVKVMKTSIINEGLTFNQTYVSAGLNSGVIFHQMADYKLKKGDVVRYDVGCVHEGYTSDLARIAVVRELTEEVEKVYKVALDAQQAAIRAIGPGVRLSEVYGIGKQAVEQAGYPMPWPHVGHSIGINFEEPPFITPQTNMEFEPNMVFCVEIYYPVAGFGGINIEDMVLVTEAGCEPLSTMERGIHVSRS